MASTPGLPRRTCAFATARFLGDEGPCRRPPGLLLQAVDGRILRHLEHLPSHPTLDAKPADVEQRVHHGADQVLDADWVAGRLAAVPGRLADDLPRLQPEIGRAHV